MTVRTRPLILVLLLLGAPPIAGACAHSHRHAHGCDVTVYHSPVPAAKEWDDLGVAQVDCALDVGRVQCLAQLRAEACRMGGDLLYDVPDKPRRPTDQGMTYYGRVARRRVKASPDDEDAATGHPDAGTAGEESREPSGPISPLVMPQGPAQQPGDGGAR
jgi:hypothetical protein